MAQDVAHEQHVKWLKEQIDQKKSELAQVEAKAVELKASIVYYEGMLAVVAAKKVASTPTEMLPETQTLTLNGGQVASTSSLGADEHLKGGLANFTLASEDASFEKASSQNRHQRSPMEMKRPQYVGLTFAESIEKILNARQEPMLVDRIVEAIFDAESEEEFWRAKNSLSVELRRGAEPQYKRWKKLSRNIYASNSFNQQSASNTASSIITPQMRFSLTNSDDALSS
ncbi:hypothetical protein [Microcoleus vaginatus]|uniref:hypothetical protein n=1 Tax=Microcoleus vaginatus TaxID=119532 RepID=UPI001F604635|nr:hypothetical protein D0A37_02725 [Microcoleus vaginatus HSN003]